MYALKTFTLIRHLIPENRPPPGFWPGDDIESNTLASEEYKAVSEGRMKKLRKFTKSPDFDECLVKACVSSVPRWRYVRELELDPSKKRKSQRQEMIRILTTSSNSCLSGICITSIGAYIYLSRRTSEGLHERRGHSSKKHAGFYGDKTRSLSSSLLGMSTRTPCDC